jgi:mono/diheme cytochrome c family protein
MRRSHPVVGAFLLAGLGVCAGFGSAAQDSSPQTEAEQEYKPTAEDLAKKNPIKPTPEGLAEAKKVYGYDCAMCHGAKGDGKGDLVESMKLTMHDWHDAASLEGKTDGELFYIITKGKGKMIGEGDRQSERLRWNLVNLVRSFAAKGAPAKPEVRPIH